MPEFSDAVDSLLWDATEMWHASGTTFTPPGRTYTRAEQTTNAVEVRQARATLAREIPPPHASGEERERSHSRIAAAFVRFARCGLSLEDDHATLLLEGGFTKIAPALDKEARRFDPCVTDADILQACRNAWTGCGLQCLFGVPMGLTPALFAYSMLYPYSDNYMDDASISADAKRTFSRRFGHRLAGENLAPANAHEETIWRLVALIESQYLRAATPAVFESLLAIHRAQEESLRLLTACDDPLPIVFRKGGASVLADGFLAAGNLPSTQAAFAFAWGVLLQLGDDLQDVVEDAASGCTTLFTAAAQHGTLDEWTNRTFRFAREVLHLMDVIPGEQTLKGLIERSTFGLLVRAAAKNAQCYSPAYLAALEPYSPVPFQMPAAISHGMVDTKLQSQYL